MQTSSPECLQDISFISHVKMVACEEYNESLDSNPCFIHNFLRKPANPFQRILAVLRYPS